MARAQIFEDKQSMQVRFSLSLNHDGNVEVVGDSERTMKALLTYVKTLRHGLGLETTIIFTMKKGQTGRVERAIP